jgi:hypothetical protein
MSFSFEIIKPIVYHIIAVAVVFDECFVAGFAVVPLLDNWLFT